MREETSGAPPDRGAVPYPDSTASTPQQSGCTLQAYAVKKGLPVDFLTSVGLSDFHLFGNPAIRIPYKTLDGTEAAVRFRIALSGDDKFRWRKNSEPQLYGLERLSLCKPGDTITLVEGESDCHTLWCNGIPALGLPGAGSWREDRDAAALNPFSVIYVVIEPDQGGEAVAKWLSRSSIRDRVRLVKLPHHKDPSELWLADPSAFPDRWQAALDASVPWSAAHDEAQKQANEQAYRQCERLAHEPNILAALEQALLANGLVGESRNAQLLYLAMTSRLFQRPVSFAVKGPSSGGKSFLVETVLSYFPPGAAHCLSAMSERALAYSEEPLAHRMLVLYEAAGMQGDMASYLIRSLLSEGRVRYETVEKTKDGMKARLIEREGPTGLIVTTTASGLHPENETRLLSLSVADGPEQTKAIMRAMATNRAHCGPQAEEWHALQRWLENMSPEVTIPFAPALGELIPPMAVRLRRDFKALLTLIEAHALLHRASRSCNENGEVVAEFSDYAAVYDLVADLISDGIEATVPPVIRETVKAVAEAGELGSLSVTKLAKLLGVDKSAASHRANKAIARGYLKNEETRKGRPARLVIADPMPSDTGILPLPALLEVKCCGVESGS